MNAYTCCCPPALTLLLSTHRAMKLFRRAFALLGVGAAYFNAAAIAVLRLVSVWCLFAALAAGDLSAFVPASRFRKGPLVNTTVNFEVGGIHVPTMCATRSNWLACPASRRSKSPHSRPDRPASIDAERSPTRTLFFAEAIRGPAASLRQIVARACLRCRGAPPDDHFFPGANTPRRQTVRRRHRRHETAILPDRTQRRHGPPQRRRAFYAWLVLDLPRISRCQIFCTRRYWDGLHQAPVRTFGMALDRVAVFLLAYTSAVIYPARRSSLAAGARCAAVVAQRCSRWCRVTRMWTLRYLGRRL